MNSILPILMRPKLLGLRNRWRTRDKDRSGFLRDSVLIGFGISLMLAIYYFFIWALAEANRFSELAYLPPFIPFSIILLVLFMMLFITSLVSSLGSLYLSQDLDFLLASPIRKSRFFIGKYLDVLLSSAWMPIIFIFPVILAFGVYYKTTASFYLICLLALVPYFMIPPALGMIAAGLFTILVPAKHTRQLLVVALLFFIFFLYRIVELINWSAQNHNDVEEILRMLNVLSLPHVTWLPSHWTARIISESIEMGLSGIWLEVSLLLFVVISLLTTAFLVILNFHSYGYSKAISGMFKSRNDVFILRKWLKHFESIVPPDLRAIASKEYSFFFREVTQSVQLILLIGIYVVYLYNLKVFRVIGGLPLETRLLWENLVFIINICMGSFVTTAVCTRFVFPSLSLEGKAFWMFQTAPITLRRILECKFMIWYPPIGFLSSLLLAAGIYVVQVGSWAVLVNYFTGWIISYGLVGLAVGFGAVFANFDWEHTSQLAASFGSMVFMLVATVLIAFNLVLVEMVVFLVRMIPRYQGSAIYFCAALGFAICFGLVLLNLYTTESAMKYGTRALEDAQA